MEVQKCKLGRSGHAAVMDIMRGLVIEKEKGEEREKRKKEEMPLLGEGRGDEGFFGILSFGKTAK